MKKALALVILSAAVLSFAAPVKSMLGAGETEGASPIPLPDGVVAVEYIESTGEQYIDTGYVPNSSTAYTLIAAYTGNNKRWNRLFGTQIDGVGKTLTIRSSEFNGGGFYFESGGGATIGSIDTDIHTFSFYNGEAYFDGEKVFVQRPPSNLITSSVWLCGNNNVSHQLGEARIYCCKLYYGSILANEFIPVRFQNEQGEWVGAMYDLVSESLFFNSGSGSFIIGPDKE